MSVWGSASPQTAGMCSKEMYPLSPVDQYRLQLYQYAVVAQRLYPGPYPPPYPRLPIGLRPEEPKPQHSYIGLIAMAILSSPEYKLVLSDIYQYILDHYPYFRTRGPGWRNSIRHNLSLNDCFVKAGRSANGKGHYWAIHPANVEDFKKGDFRRRKAQRKVRRHMGLAVDDDGADSPSPPPPPVPPTAVQPAAPSTWPPRKKRQFDVASLLAPDPEEETSPWPCHTLNRQLMAKYYQQTCISQPQPETCIPRV